MPNARIPVLPNHDDHLHAALQTLPFLIVAALRVLLFAAIGAAAIAAGVLIYRIAFPSILAFPWSLPPETSRRRKREKEMTVVFAGSFNPPHWGHFAMIRYLAER